CKPGRPTHRPPMPQWRREARPRLPRSPAHHVRELRNRPLNQPWILPDPHGAESNIQVGKPDAKKRQPCPQHVLLVEPRYPAPDAVAAASLRKVVRAAKAVELATHQVTHRVASESKTAKQEDIDPHDDGTQAHTELAGPFG